MATNMKKDHMPEGVSQRLDSGGRGAMFVKETTSLDPISYSGDCPFWTADLYAVSAPDALDPAAEPVAVCEFGSARLKISRRTAPMSYTFRRVDADELHFVHKGRAIFLTEAGTLDVPAGRFVFITRGVGYRVIPTSGEFMSVIFESEEQVRLAENVERVGIPIIQPSLPMAFDDANGQMEWEERLKTGSWSLSIIRSFDPVRSTEVRLDDLPVFALDVEAVPAHETDGDRRGQPFIIFQGPEFHLEVVMPSSAMPFYHRNVRANETQFVHYGTGDRFSALGYVDAPMGTLNNYPKGIDHRIGERSGPCIGLIWETLGDVTLAQGVPTR
jgi:homogentisate 1,2-dioxygenase